MAKFDTTSIEGFDGMSDADKLSALLGAEIPDKVDLTGYVKKDVFDKTASDLAAAKKRISEGQTAEEAAKEQRDAEFADLNAKYAALVEKSTISEYKASYLGMGYSDADATKMATAMFKNDTAAMFSIMTAHNAAMKDAVKAELLKSTPRPEGAGSDSKPEDSSVALAKKLGAAKAAARRAADEGIKAYIK